MVLGGVKGGLVGSKGVLSSGGGGGATICSGAALCPPSSGGGCGDLLTWYMMGFLTAFPH